MLGSLILCNDRLSEWVVRLHIDEVVQLARLITTKLSLNSFLPQQVSLSFVDRAGIVLRLLISSTEITCFYIMAREGDFRLSWHALGLLEPLLNNGLDVWYFNLVHGFLLFSNLFSVAASLYRPYTT